MAEGVGFEPTKGCPLPVFKTGTFGHSVTLPFVYISISCTYITYAKNSEQPLAKSRTSPPSELETPPYCL